MKSNLKLEITFDGKSIYDGAPVDVDIGDEHLSISTEIGKTNKQKLRIFIKDMNYVESEEIPTDKDKKVNEN